MPVALRQSPPPAVPAAAAAAWLGQLGVAVAFHIVCKLGSSGTKLEAGVGWGGDWERDSAQQEIVERTGG